MCKPIESRRRLLNMIKESKHPIQIKEVLKIEDEERLWFGPGTDAIDFLLAQETLGVIKIDFEKVQVEAA